jgi:hypothetical protein
MITGGVIDLKGNNSKASLVYGQMNEPPGARARVALTGLTVAEYFRDAENQDVLLFIDNIFRFTQVIHPNIIGCGYVSVVSQYPRSANCYVLDVVLHIRPVLRCLPFLVVSRPLSDTRFVVMVVVVV